MKEGIPSEGQSTRFLVIEIAVAIVLAGVVWRVNRGASPAWWAGLSPFWKRLSEGILLQIVALAFFWTRIGRRAVVPRSFWDLKMFLFDIAMFVGGTVCWVEAFKLR
jgi:hypothetical protein